MSEGPRTDFEVCGFSAGVPRLSGRFFLLTIDMEAFQLELMPLWLELMEYWADRAGVLGLRFCFFLAVEDVVHLRAANPGIYQRFLHAMRLLESAGSIFYPHNHYVFDPTTGGKAPVGNEPAGPSRDYPKRQCLFYDTVLRHRRNFGEWLADVRRSYQEIMAEAGCRLPDRLAFRAGGWDYGGSCAELEAYIRGLKAAGFRVDSSACRGTFGAETWRVGTLFGANAFLLEEDLLEIAPTWAIDVSVPPWSLAYLRTLLSLREHSGLVTTRRGAFVVVLHFDHLFRRQTAWTIDEFAVRDIRRLEARIDRLFWLLVVLRGAFRLRCVTFEECG